jgi:putative transferase (TIGR04331 family)
VFLATTGDPRLWDTGQKILFLGEWCRLHDQRDRWQALDHDVLPYPFDDRARLARGYAELQPVYLRTLDALAAALNTVHATRHGTRFWEIVAGLWLREFLEIVYERYACLREALARGTVRSTKILASSCYVVPRDSLEFASLYEGDFYNAQLYSQIMRALRPRGIDLADVVISGADAAHQSRPPLRRVLKRIRDVISSVLLVASRWNRVVMVSTYFPPIDLFRLSLACRSFPLFDTPRWRATSGRAIDGEARAGIRGALEASTQPTNEFERLLPGLIAANLPRIVLEDFGAASLIVRRWFPRSPRVVVTANGFAYNDLFKHWTGLAVERGVPFVILQHGGSYGCAQWNSSEDYETRIADRYYTFGWDDPSKSNVVPWSSSRLRHPVSRSDAAPTQGDILWVVVSFPRYSYTMYSVPVGPQTLSYLAYQHRFARAVSADVRRLLLYRPYPLRYGWSDESRLREAAGDLRIAGTTQSMHRQLARSRLFVGTFNATAFLETFVADVPTVLFWEPRLWELRPDAVPYFDGLRRVGILHDTPEAAAGFIETIYRNPEEWWRRSEVTEAVGLFRNRFARVHDRSLVDWRAEFDRLAGAQRNVVPCF